MPGNVEVRMKSIVNRVEDLPTLPTVVTRIMRLVEDPDASAEDIGSLIVQDPSLTATILKIVNSPFYGFSGRVSSVTNAVVILGFKSVKNLVLSASVFEVFQGEGSQRFDRVGLWKHSIATGVCAELASETIDDVNTEEVMAAGILHAVGKIVMDQYCPKEFKRVLDYVRDHQCTMLEAERELLDVAHPEIGGWLAEHWNLPQDLQLAIRHYPDPTQAPANHQKLPALIHVGNILAQTKDIGWTGCRDTPMFQENIWMELGLRERDIKRILSRLQSRMQDAEVFLNLTLEKAS